MLAREGSTVGTEQLWRVAISALITLGLWCFFTMPAKLAPALPEPLP